MPTPNIRQGEDAPKRLTPPQLATALTELTAAETAYVNTVNSIAELTGQHVVQLCPPVVQFQNIRDNLLHSYLEWDELRKQFDGGLITFEEFVNKIHYEMTKLQVQFPGCKVSAS